ncbi:restriction endonuclease subunit S [Chishuiella sp.]|uniref:restriction endonuclease subunit S n=1 Tax=Chishuiella sp. TaxID=1969467 RepID=UPI0028ACD541|nr:restriction endonuclease subunit S [Chishuiella sp.]
MTKTTQYKNTPIGPIPMDWEVKKLGELGETLNGLTYSPKDIVEENKGILVLRSSNIQNDNLVFDDNVFVKSTNLKYNPVELNDILICVRNGSKSLIGKNTLITEEAKGMAFGAFMSIYRSELNSYLYHCFKSDIYQNHINKNLGATINSINGSDLKQFSFPLPPLPEQQKITEVLSTWDKAIKETDAIIKKLEKRNKALAFSLLRGKMVSKNFKEITLSKFLTFTQREIDKPTENYLALGIRSHGKGLFHKPDSDPKAIAMEKLYEVKENDFIVNITFAWEHAVAIVSKEDVGGLVSHRFPTYEIDTNQVKVEYFRHLILQPFFRKMLENISPGGAGRNRVLSKKDLLKLKVSIPTLEEQDKVAEILNTANQEVKRYQQKLEALKLQKKGLMQQLLTGKVRTV